MERSFLCKWMPLQPISRCVYDLTGWLWVPAARINIGQNRWEIKGARLWNEYCTPYSELSVPVCMLTHKSGYILMVKYSVCWYTSTYVLIHCIHEYVYIFLFCRDTSRGWVGGGGGWGGRLLLQEILQGSTRHTDPIRPPGRVWPRKTKELGLYASPWPIAVQESSRHEVTRNKVG